MKHILFKIPIWKENIDVSKIQLKSSNFKPSFLSGVLSTFGGKNIISEEGSLYLGSKLKEILSDDYKIEKITVHHIWKNVYQNDFQDKHNHAGCHFSFVAYERIEKPQTVFFHPAHNLIYASKAETLYKTNETLDVVQNDIIIFPSYLDHMVPMTKDALTISGNFDIE